MQITNLSEATQDYVIKGEIKNGVPPTESLAPGETKNIDVLDSEAAQIIGRVVAGTIRVGGPDRKRPKE